MRFGSPLISVILGLPGFDGAVVSFTMVNLKVAEAVERPSDACTVTFGAVATVGVPVILPVAALIERPAGRPVEL